MTVGKRFPAVLRLRVFVLLLPLPCCWPAILPSVARPLLLLLFGSLAAAVGSLPIHDSLAAVVLFSFFFRWASLGPYVHCSLKFVYLNCFLIRDLFFFSADLIGSVRALFPNFPLLVSFHFWHDCSDIVYSRYWSRGFHGPFVGRFSVVFVTR